MTAPAVRAIRVREASTHNLKNVSCEFPHHRLTVVTGVSGSGKSSLAFDTVYAEGQRRYVETLSTYVRQFLQQMQKPPVKSIEHLQPSLAIRQHNPISNARATVGSVSELETHLQTLFAGVGQIECYRCSDHVRPFSPTDVVAWLRENADGERVVVAAEVEPEEGAGMATLLQQLAADGFRRLWLNGAMVDIESEDALAALEQESLQVVIDRVSVTADSARLFEAAEAAMGRGHRVAIVLLWDRRDELGVPGQRRFESRYVCSSCGAEHHEPVPALLSPDSGWGDCEDCNGYGRRAGIDLNKLVPDTRLSLEKKAVAAFRTPKMLKHHRDLVSECAHAGVPIDVPWDELHPNDRKLALYGGKGVTGAVTVLEDLRSRYRYKASTAVLLSRYTGYVPCATCAGSGLGRTARAVKIDGLHIGEVQDLRLELLSTWLRNMPLGDARKRAVDGLVQEMIARADFLVRAGAGYLSLSRRGRTLSGGELHRVMLATSIGRGLTDTCYVLDEPTAGLHAADTERLMGIIEELRDLGNTVVIVEHDAEVMAAAEHVIELGPYGGEQGGELLFEGSYEALRASDTPTGQMLREPPHRGTPSRYTPMKGFLSLDGADLHNLRDLSVRFPIGAMSVVTGVSGSGKSTLVHDVLYTALMRARGFANGETDPGDVHIEGDDFEEVVLVSQDAIANNARSSPLTLSDAYTPIRELFAGTEAAKRQGLAAGHFSFNVAAGRCPRCDGTGALTVEMHFLADVELPCDVCEGLRFQPNVLAVQWNGRAISDVFALTIDQAMTVFEAEARITQRLQPFVDVGLGYLRLGQSVTQLSGGEKQRIKLASYLGGRTKAGTRLFLFDEPTVGLHLRDVAVLLRALRRLTDDGHTVIVVEHNLAFIRACDWVVDLGPGAGPAGGELVYEGDLATLLEDDAISSLTGDWLRRSVTNVDAPPRR